MTVPAPMTRHERVLAAYRGQPVDRTPVWFMRQAGRYMAEYRAVREKVSFLELCADADLSAEVTCQPIDRFDVDAAIVFSDILTVPEAMGQEVVFEKGHGPRLPSPLRTRADVDALRVPDVSETTLSVAHETIRRFRALRPDHPILGFAGAPWTLFCYMVEGSGSKNWLSPKRLLWSDPDLAHRLLGMLADVVGDHLQAQIDAGAVAVQVFDTWAGALSVEDWKTYALPAVQRVFDRVSGAPRLYYSKDSTPLLPWIRETGADGVGLDWRADMASARRILGDTPVQGNLDPVLLHAPAETVRARTRQILEAAGPVGHVFNLGHGVLPSTPLEGVDAMVETVKAFRHGEGA